MLLTWFATDGRQPFLPAGQMSSALNPFAASSARGCSARLRMTANLPFPLTHRAPDSRWQRPPPYSCLKNGKLHRREVRELWGKMSDTVVLTIPCPAGTAAPMLLRERYAPPQKMLRVPLLE